MDQPQSSPEQNATEGGSKKKGLSKILIAVAVLVALAVAAFFFLNRGGEQSEPVDDSVVATVNGTEITAQQVDDRIERNRANLEAQGNDLSDPATRSLIEDQIITQLVNETLVVAEAQSLGIAVTEEQIDEEYANIRARFETEELFQSELEKNRFTEASLRANIERELLTQQYLDSVVEQDPVEVTEEEVQEFYDQVVVQQGEGVPPLEEIAEQIENQIRSQKIVAVVNEIVESLRASASIVITGEQG